LDHWYHHGRVGAFDIEGEVKMKELRPRQLFVGSLWLLCLIGVVLRYSILGSIVDLRDGIASNYLFKEEMVNLLIAFGGFLLFSRLNKTFLMKWGRPLILMSILALCLVISDLPFVHANGIASRWIHLPLIGSVQPSELSKVCLIIFMAGYLTRHRNELESWSKGFMPATLIMGLMFVLIILQPDFGTAVLLFAGGAWMMLVAGMKVKHFAVLGLAAVPSALFLILSSSYRTARVFSFFNPDADLQGRGYHVNQAKHAISHGGETFPFGQGFMQGIARHGYVPESSTDFIAVIYIEEFGILGLVLMLVLYAVLIKQIIDLAIKSKDVFDRSLLSGVGGLLGMQILINLFVVTGLMPNKGMPLPLISSGGTSLLATACLLGLVYGVMEKAEARNREEELSFETATVQGQQNWNGL
jgi:cell division protein FtsW